MIVSTWVALAVLAPVNEARFEMGVRLRQLDLAWTENSDQATKKAAVAPVSGAVAGFFQNRTDDVCAALDAAWATLRGQKADPALGVTARFARHETGKPPVLRLWLTYGDKPVVVSVNGEETEVRPGEETRIEVGKATTVTAGNRKIVLPAPPTDGQAAGVAKHETSGDPTVRGLATYARAMLNGEGEVDDHFVAALETAEGLESGAMKLGDVRELFRAQEASTVFRARFPETWSEPKTVVIGLHGAGGSENLFFEGYGNGVVPGEALKRGWAFLAPRSTPRAASDCLAWIRRVYGAVPARVFVVGHSMGGGIALGSHGLDPKPTALGLFAPAAASIPEPFRETPVYLAVGEQEMGMLKSNAMRMADRLSDKSVVKIYPDCEHLMIVADAAKDVFRFFDGLGNWSAGR